MDEFMMISRKDFDFLTEYVEDIPVSFYKAAKAVKVQDIFRSAVLMRPNQTPKDEEKK